MIDLSVIIPVYNAAPWLEPKLRSLAAYLDTLPFKTEIVVVDDGSVDDSAKRIKELPYIKSIILERNIGKFGAISAGMREASGQCRIFTDCDLPYDLEAINYMATLVRDRRFHIVTGDRTLKESQSSVVTSGRRSVASRAFSVFVRLLVTGGLFDTQCGLKALRGDVADAIFPLLREQKFAGDVELLYIALKYNLEIKRIPVRLQNAAKSSVRLLTNSLEMIGSLLVIPARWYLGYYKSAELEKISTQRYWEVI